MKLEVRKEIECLRREQERLEKIYQKSYQVNTDFTMDERDDIRYLITQRITEITIRIKSIKRELREKESVQKVCVGQVYEHYLFQDEVSINNIYVEDGKVMVETTFKMRLFDEEGKTRVREYNDLIEVLKKDYVLVKEVK